MLMKNREHQFPQTTQKTTSNLNVPFLYKTCVKYGNLYSPEKNTPSEIKKRGKRIFNYPPTLELLTIKLGSFDC